MDLLPLAAEVPFKTDFNHFAKFYQCGTHEDYKFVAMELLGPSFIQLASRHHPCRFNLHVLLKFGIQAIDALKQLHKAGFVHRDVKPDKFVIGNQQNTTGLIYLIDFGLCKKLHKENGVIAKPIQPSNFRGSLRYASPNAHKQIELGRSDDLISLFYLMIELFIGKLPWSNIANSDIVLQQKLIYRGRVLIQQMPKEFHSFEDYIFSLDYTDEPDYQLIINLFKTIAVNEGIDLSQPFDWENEINEQRSIVVQKQLEILKQRRKDQKINKNNLQQIEEEQSSEDEQSLYIQLINNQTEFSKEEYEDMYYQRTNLSIVKYIRENNLVIFAQMKKDQQLLIKQTKLEKQQKNNEKDILNKLEIKEENISKNQKKSIHNIENINKLIKNNINLENQQNNEKELIKEKQQQQVELNKDNDNQIPKHQFKHIISKNSHKHSHQQQILLEKDSQIMKDLTPYSQKSSKIQKSDHNYKPLLQHSQSQVSTPSQQQTQSQQSSAQQQSSFLQQSTQISTSSSPLIQQNQNKSDNYQNSEADFGEKSSNNISSLKSPILSGFTSLKPASSAFKFIMNVPQSTQISQEQELSQQNSKKMFQSVPNFQNLIKKHDQTQNDMENDNKDFTNSQYNIKPVILILPDRNNALMSQSNTIKQDELSLRGQKELLRDQNQLDRSQMIDQDQQDGNIYPERDISQNASHNLAQLLNIQSHGLSPHYQQSPKYQQFPHNSNNFPPKYNFAPLFLPKLYHYQSANQSPNLSPKFSPHNQLHSQRFTLGKHNSMYSQLIPSAKSQQMYQYQRNLLHLHLNQQYILTQQRVQQHQSLKVQEEKQQQLQQQQQQQQYKYQKQSESYLSSQIGKIKQQSQQLSDQSEQSVKLENTLYSASFKSYNEKNTNTQTSHQQLAPDQFNAKDQIPTQSVPSFASLHHQNQNIPPDLCSPSSAEYAHQLKQQNPALNNSSDSASLRSQDQMSYDSQMYQMSSEVSVQQKSKDKKSKISDQKGKYNQYQPNYDQKLILSPQSTSSSSSSHTSSNQTAIQKIFSQNSNNDEYKKYENLKKFNQHSIQIQKSDEYAGFYQNFIPVSFTQTHLSQSNQYTYKQSHKNAPSQTSFQNQNLKMLNSSGPTSPHSDSHTPSNLRQHSSYTSIVSNNADTNIIFGFYPQYSEIQSSKSDNFVDLIIIQNQQQEDFINNQFDEQRNQSAREIHDKASEFSNWKQFIDSVGANYVLEEQISNLEGNTLKQMMSNYQEQEIDQTQENQKDGPQQLENQIENQKMKEFEKEEIEKESKNSNNEKEMNMKNKQIMQQFDENITNEKEDDPKQTIQLNKSQQQTLNFDQNKQNQDNNNEQQQQINLIQLAEKFYQLPESEISKGSQFKFELFPDNLQDEKIKNINEYDTNNNKEHEEMNLINNNNKIHYDDNNSQQNQIQKKKKKIQGLKRQNKQQQFKFNEDYTKINIKDNALPAQYLNMENNEELNKKDNQDDSIFDEDIILPNQVLNDSINKLWKTKQLSLPQSKQSSQQSYQTSLSSQSTPQKSIYFSNSIDNNSNQKNKFLIPDIENIHSQTSLLFQTPTNSQNLSFSLNSYQPDNSNFISTELSTSILSAATNSPHLNALPSISPPQITIKSCSPPTNFHASTSQLNNYQASTSKLNNFQASTSQLNNFQASTSKFNNFQTSAQLVKFQTSSSELANSAQDQLDNSSQDQLNPLQTLLQYNQPISYSQNNQQINHTGSTYSSSIQSMDNLLKTQDQPDQLINLDSLQIQPLTKKRVPISKISNSPLRKNVIISSSFFSYNNLSSISSLLSSQSESNLNNQKQEEQNEKLRQQEVQGDENINNGIVQKYQQMNAWSDDKEMKEKTQLSENQKENLQENEISKIKEKTDVNINSSFNANQHCCIIL